MTDYWLSTDPPYVQLFVLREGQHLDRAVAPPPGFAVKVVSGTACTTKQALLAEFARVLEFPSYFGMNWDAFEECVTDLRWLPARGYLIIMTDADQVLRSHEEEYTIFITILKNAGKEWATPRGGEWPRPAIPFHVLLTIAEAKARSRTDWDLPLLLGAD